MKNVISSLLVVLTLMSFSPNAKAVGGLIAGQYLIAAIGGVAGVAGVPLLSLANRYAQQARRRGYRSEDLKIASLVVGIVGTILWIGGGYMLDGENNDFKFLPIESDQLTSAERIYNSELDELNAVKDMVAQDLATTELNTMDEIHEFTKLKWEEYGGALSPETLHVRAQIVNQLTTR